MVTPPPPPTTPSSASKIVPSIIRAHLVLSGSSGCSVSDLAPGARGRNKQREHLSRDERSCSPVWRETGARSPEPAAPPLGWTGAASPLDRCPGRNVPAHLHTKQDWRGHPSAHLSGRSGVFKAASYSCGGYILI